MRAGMDHDAARTRRVLCACLCGLTALTSLTVAWLSYLV
mgnify:CR=1 FL=1